MAKSKTHPVADDATRAEREGDYRRARALSHLLLAGQGGNERRGVGQADILAQATGRIARLAVDARAWQMGLLALIVYGAAWAYALTANR